MWDKCSLFIWMVFGGLKLKLRFPPYFEHFRSQYLWHWCICKGNNSEVKGHQQQASAWEKGYSPCRFVSFFHFWKEPNYPLFEKNLKALGTNTFENWMCGITFVPTKRPQIWSNCCRWILKFFPCSLQAHTAKDWKFELHLIGLEIG